MSRTLPVDLRLHYRDQKIQYLQKIGVNFTSKVIIVVEYLEASSWKTKCYVCGCHERLSFILMKMRTKLNLPDSTFLMATKTKCLLNLSQSLKEIYEHYKDPDDHILYLSASKNHYFGWAEITMMKQFWKMISILYFLRMPLLSL